MQDQVVRVSESRYGKGFVIFQVALPLILQILGTLVRKFLFLSAQA